MTPHLNSLPEAPRIVSRLLTHEAAAMERLGPLRRFAWWQVEKRFRRGPIDVAAFDGTATLRCFPDSAASNSVIYFGWPDWFEMRLLHRALRPGDRFLDIGANVGVYSVLAAGKVMPGGRIIAFEAEPRVLDRLRQNFALNGLDASDVHAVAIGASAGTCRFEVGRDSLGGVAVGRRHASIEVPMVRMDDVISPGDDLTIAKIDVEGYELAVLRGATALLEARRPRCWIVETNALSARYGESRNELLSLFADFGFGLYRVVDEDPFRLSPIRDGGPYPQNALAVADLGWLGDRLPGLVVDP